MKMTTKAIAVMAATVLLFSTAGIAIAADSSVPGDSLYGVKLALEKMGVGAGGVEERLDEASTLAERGEIGAGLEHAALALAGEGEDTEESAESLLAAAEAVESGGDAESAQVRARVAEMLRWMATTDATGREFGQGVAARARDISPGDAEAAEEAEGEDDEDAGPPEGVPGGRPEGVPPGPPEGAGKP